MTRSTEKCVKRPPCHLRKAIGPFAAVPTTVAELWGFLQQPRVHRWDTVHMSHRFRAQVNDVQLHEANIYSAAV